MALSYNKLWKMLIDRNMTKTQLRHAVGLCTVTLARMSKGESVGANVLERICASMKCNIGDIVDYVPDEANTKTEDVEA
jgi:DNA-binding Xre family transcriptional regulator